MALPAYATTGQRVWHYTYRTFCGLVLFFLVAPLIVVIPLSFTSSAFLIFTPEMLAFDPEGYSLRWYRLLIGDCSDALVTTVCSDKWVVGAKNSLFIAVVATTLATTLGTLAALGLSRPEMPYRKLIMAIMISPLIVPLIIVASGMFLFFAKFKLVATFTGLILAHTALGLPFVVITVTATLVGFDTSLTRAAASLGSGPTRAFFKVQMPLILPGVISGGLFAFITSFDEVVVVLFIGGRNQMTLPRQMWSGIRQEISPTILSAATILVLFAIVLLVTLELLRRRSERLRGLTPA
ncbi:MAG: ABC transporter permease [Alphaproteobacteria bacterium]|jgi:putative spermidine/putrescine transport system permease protein